MGFLDLVILIGKDLCGDDIDLSSQFWYTT